MKKYAFGLGLMLLATLLVSGLVQSVDEPEGQKSKTNQDIMSDPHCKKAEQLPESKGAAGHCQRAQSGCRAGEGMGMMPMMQMCPMMHKMMMGKRMHQGPMQKVSHSTTGKFSRLGSPGFLIHRAKTLGLSDEQVDKLKAFERDQQKLTIKKKADLQVARVELMELLDQDPVNFGKLEAKISQLSEMEKEIHLAHLTTIQKSRKVLTSEQLEKAKTLKKGRSPMMKKDHRTMAKEMHMKERTQKKHTEEQAP